MLKTKILIINIMKLNKLLTKKLFILNIIISLIYSTLFFGVVIPHIKINKLENWTLILLILLPNINILLILINPLKSFSA